MSLARSFKWSRGLRAPASSSMMTGSVVAIGERRSKWCRRVTWAGCPLARSSSIQADVSTRISGGMRGHPGARRDPPPSPCLRARGARHGRPRRGVAPYAGPRPRSPPSPRQADPRRSSGVPAGASVDATYGRSALSRRAARRPRPRRPASGPWAHRCADETWRECSGVPYICQAGLHLPAPATGDAGSPRARDERRRPPAAGGSSGPRASRPRRGWPRGSPTRPCTRPARGRPPR